MRMATSPGQTDINTLITYLEGLPDYELLNPSSEGVSVDVHGSVTVKLGDDLGARTLTITDVNDVVVVSIDSDGKVGIGRTSQGAKLEVYTTDWTDYLPLVNITNLDANAIQSYALLLRGGANNLVGLTFQVQDYDGNTDFVITGNGNVGIGATPFQKLTLEHGHYIAWPTAAGQANSRSWGIRNDFDNFGDFSIRSSDANDNTLDTTRLVIDKDGNLGIGVSPSTRLHVKGSTSGASETVVTINARPNSIGEYIELLMDSTWTARGEVAVRAIVGAVTTDMDMAFLVDTGAGRYEAARITGALGYFGLGTSSPQERASVNGNLNLPKTAGFGIKVDLATPTFGWRDLRAEIRTRGVGGTDPNDSAYIGNVKAYAFSVNDEAWIEFHIPHDYVPGTDIHLHFHWSHNSAVVTGGTITLGADVTYAKGHNQGVFAATVNPTLVATAIASASNGQYRQMIDEVQLSASSPSGTQIDTDDLEPDGLVLARVYLAANNITSGGAVPDPFIHEVDLHYQSTSISTKDKVPDFYT